MKMSEVPVNPVRLGRGERGVTGIETAIILIAFVVVASVFSFAILSTGVLSSEKAKETVLGGLAETSASITLRGEVIAHNTTSPSQLVEYLTFQVSNASRAGEAVSLAGGDVIVSYTDK